MPGLNKPILIEEFTSHIRIFSRCLVPLNYPCMLGSRSCHGKGHRTTTKYQENMKGAQVNLDPLNKTPTWDMSDRKNMRGFLGAYWSGEWSEEI